MNLWSIFPEFLLFNHYILYLPYVALAAYFFVIYALVAFPTQRFKIALFLLLSMATTALMVTTFGPRIGTVIPPLMLLLVMLLPLLVLTEQIIKQNKVGVRIWVGVSLSGWAHSLSWIVWLMAAANS